MSLNHHLTSSSHLPSQHIIYISTQRHLGKGSYSDVFEVVCKDNDILLRAKNKKMDNVGTSPGSNRRRSTPRGRRSTLSSSITVATLSRPLPTVSAKSIVLAMKCLRPQIRSDIDQFTIGAEDLVHETAILANLSHPNIIKLHGRSSGNLTDSFKTNDGYFILLDKLNETLLDRIVTWKKDPKCITIKGPNLEQIQVAQSIAKAMGYLHSKKIIFRDLKPDNVGFDSQGVSSYSTLALPLVCQSTSAIHAMEWCLRPKSLIDVGHHVIWLPRMDCTLAMVFPQMCTRLG